MNELGKVRLRILGFIDEQLLKFKKLIELAIETDGENGKSSIIRSSTLINLIHDAVKHELIKHGANPDNIYPKLGESRPEIKIAGFLKQKNQDVCIIPSNIEMKRESINWGPVATEGVFDQYGFEFSQNILVVNVRSQLSSLAKNSDTLFERTFAEALNLHLRYPEMVLGEVYLIPVYEYDDLMVKNRQVGFKISKTNIEKYISFFHAMNGRIDGDEDYKYERASLLIVDFTRDTPKLYRTTQELRDDGLISDEFKIGVESLSFDTFADDILKTYAQRFNLGNITQQSK